MATSQILVIIDPTREHQPALQRAIVAAKTLDYSVHLFASIHEESDCNSKHSKNTFVQQCLKQQREKLEALAEEARSGGILVSTEVDWDSDWTNAAIRASMRNNSNILFKSTFKHSLTERVIRKTTDWTILRNCLCPVLLVREDTRWDSHKILAAVSVENTDSAHKEINQTIIDLGQKVAKSYDSEVHFINAYNDSLSHPDANYLAKECGVPDSQIHMKVGAPEDAIVDKSKELAADLIVIGTVARSGVAGWISGNTAEKVLDRVECDVLALP